MLDYVLATRGRVEEPAERTYSVNIWVWILDFALFLQDCGGDLV